MKSQKYYFVVFTILLAFIQRYNPAIAQQTNWPQFRGPNCSGIADKNSIPPTELNEKTMLWKTSLAMGHSSPCVWGENIFLTAFIKEKSELQTICIDRITGNVKWKHSIFPDTVEGYHPGSSAAQTSPTTDGERVYLYFGSYGLLCYNMKGQLVWERPMSANSNQSAGSSPILYGDSVILCRDAGEDHELLKINKMTGDILWEVKLPVSGGNPYKITHSTPIIYKDCIILHRIGEISAYSINSGDRVWWYPILTQPVSTPIIDRDVIYISAWHNFSEKELRVELPEYTELISVYDKDQDGLINQNEMSEELLVYTRPEITGSEFGDTKGRIIHFWWMIDTDKDGNVNQEEWGRITALVKSFYTDAGLFALKPKGTGQQSVASVVWKVNEKVPEVPSPICNNGFIYMCKNGGILTCIDSETGEIYFRKRIGAAGPYIASPISINDYIYFTSGKGKITVIKAGEELNVVAQSDLKEKIFATPAIINSSIYIRTNEHLYAFTQN